MPILTLSDFLDGPRFACKFRRLAMVNSPKGPGAYRYPAWMGFSCGMLVLGPFGMRQTLRDVTGPVSRYIEPSDSSVAVRSCSLC